MTTFNLRASNNATFRLTRDLSQWATIYNLSAATIRMQARTSPFAPDPPAYQWVTGAASGGIIAFSASNGLCVVMAPLADMANLPSQLFYDCRLEFSGGSTVVLFSGRLTVSPGLTHMAGDSSAVGVVVGDTVTVDGETPSSPTALAATVTSANFGAVFAAWFNALPTALPSSAGQFWNNGGVLAQS